MMVALLGMALGAGGILAAVTILLAFSDGQLLSLGASYPKLIISVLILLGIAVIIAAYDFGFRRCGV
jgi:hypothetical protein